MVVHKFCKKCNEAICVDVGPFDIKHFTHKRGIRVKGGFQCIQCKLGQKSERGTQKEGNEW